MTTTEARPANAQVKSGLAPYIFVRDCAGAIEFYKQAFGAEEAQRMPAEDGKRIMHAHLYVNGGSLLLNDFFPEFGMAEVAPAAFQLHIQLTEGIDGWWKRALDAGCQVNQPLENQFWGDRYGQLKDPYGVTWSLGQTGG